MPIDISDITYYLNESNVQSGYGFLLKCFSKEKTQKRYSSNNNA